MAGDVSAANLRVVSAEKNAAMKEAVMNPPCKVLRQSGLYTRLPIDRANAASTNTCRVKGT